MNKLTYFTACCGAYYILCASNKPFDELMNRTTTVIEFDKNLDNNIIEEHLKRLSKNDYKILHEFLTTNGSRVIFVSYKSTKKYKRKQKT